MGWVRVPTRLTEGIIAVSVAVAALNNIWPILSDQKWMVAFGFGLVHGFGFASALGGIELSGTELISSLAGFNCGVEAGQLAVVAVIFPLAYLMRNTSFYQVGVLRVGSLCVVILAFYWTVGLEAGCMLRCTRPDLESGFMILGDAGIRMVRAPRLCKALRCSVKADKFALLIALQCGLLRCGWAGA